MAAQSISNVRFGGSGPNWTNSKQEDGLRRPSVDMDAFTTIYLTSDLQNLMSSVGGGAGEYSLSVLSKLFKAFMRYCDNNIYPDERMNERGGRTALKTKALADTIGWRGHRKKAE